MRCNLDGNLWCSWGMGNEAVDGVFAFAPDGTRGASRSLSAAPTSVSAGPSRPSGEAICACVELLNKVIPAEGGGRA